MENTLKWTPATKKTWLYLTAGIMWSGVGIMLIAFAAAWLSVVHSWIIILLLLSGLLLAAGIYFFGFSKLASKNVQRILGIPKERVCVFAFQKWSSYPLIMVMIATGIFLRHSSLPKPYLAILYLGLGVSLFASSFLYYLQIIRTAKT
jgi:hypothetical protein